MRKASDLVGQAFGEWVVVKRGRPRPNKHLYWLCRCSCGKEKEVATTTLRSGQSQSCGHGRGFKKGHIPVTRLPEGQAACRDLFVTYRNGAKRKGVAFDITFDDFKSITQQPCVYCGSPPTHEYYRNRTYGAYIGNGIDRKENALGYTIHSAVSCCLECNYAKRDKSYDAFINHIRRVYEYHVRDA